LSLIVCTAAAVASNGKRDSSVQENQVYFDQQPANNARRRYGQLAEIHARISGFFENILTGFLLGIHHRKPKLLPLHG